MLESLCSSLEVPPLGNAFYRSNSILRAGPSVFSREGRRLRTDKMAADQMTPKSDEAEAFERRGRRLSVNRRLFFFGEDEFEGEASIVDISTNGCKATSLSEVKIGLTLKLSLFLQDQQWPLRIDHAVVRWVDGQNFGMEFTGIRPAQRERLRAILMRGKE
jgi:hypothetical protein